MKIEATVRPSPIGRPVADVAHVAPPIGGQPSRAAALSLFLICMRRVEEETRHLLRLPALKNPHPWLGGGRSVPPGRRNKRNRCNR